MTTISDLQELHISRQEAQEAKAYLQQIMKAFEESDQYKEAKYRVGMTADLVDQLEAQIKHDALDLMEKHPFPGVTVKDVSSFVYDPKQALTWCKSNLPTALKLDTKPFEAVVKVGGIVPEEIAHIEIVKRAEIAADLSKHLPADPE